MFRYNKGEWTELYVLLKLLGTWRLSSVDVEYTIRRIYKEENGLIFECNLDSNFVSICDNDNNIINEVDRMDFEYYSDIVFKAILTNSKTF